MRILFITLFAGLLAATRAFAAPLPEPVSAALKHAHIPLSSVGIVVQGVNETEPVVSLNAERSMNPASTMKLLTTYASLETLGPAYRWNTEAYLDGKLEDGVLEGDLVFKGYGDPKLTLEQFWMWLRELRQRGLREIRGNLVLDHSFFEPVSENPAEFDNDPTRAYNVGTDALLLNFNALHLHLIPNGHETIAMLEPELDGYTVRNHITTSVKLHCGAEDSYRARLDGHDIVLEGKIPASCGEADDYFSLLPQDEYFFAVFSSLWKELGGTLLGKLRSGTAPAGQAPFSRYQSPQLSEVIRDINKFSNNIMARQLFLTLGAAAPVMNPAESSQNAGNAQQSDGKDVSGVFSNPQANGSSSLLAEQEGGDTADTDLTGARQPSGSPEGQASAVNIDVVTSEAGSAAVAGDPIAGARIDSATATPPALAGRTPKPGNLLSSKPDAELTTPAGTPPRLGDLPAANIVRSTAAMQQWLKTQQLEFPELVLENGAGLSRKERISPLHLAALLQRASSSPFYAELQASLPILGLDGTVKKRFKDNEIAGYAHLKTGSLEGVKSIAGYVKARSGKQWIVVFLVNHPNAALAQPAQDALIEWLQKEH
ncbi:MAG TPA: D-alanyl-D-alanine carboxypeptidase/D-alanyl-D-alanine-endopeptidase [Gallionella sp.]|nr:D-alanyl-D-alanine carboxypeptidase/D-alanyl-D-alanine-endopeptidase [Gallionella sp.]